MTEGMANAIMCCKYWLGFDELSSAQDILQESDIVEEGGEGNTDLDAEVGDDIEE